TDKTKESVSEIAKEFQGVTGQQPVTDKELAKAQKDETLTLAGAWESSGQVAHSIAEIIRFGLPENYFETFPDKVLALKLDDVNKAARRVVQPKNLIWVIVGDRSKIEPGLRELGFGDIQLIDTNGRVIK
ncbi:MAG: peptidase domain protein, partial [Verrucomicrobiales bacterium]|nr:peptidase domain protein [Verrucomicrobiales bacterium]